MTLRKLLLDTRKQLDLSQKQLADILGLEEKDIYNLEYGDMMWNSDSLEKKARKIVNEFKKRNVK
jgi:DNA-binding XRE family transcriptional regulator